ncbi:MAG: LuxR C-terminal-related transcriptional regulator [Caldilineaceae bacterium]
MPTPILATKLYTPPPRPDLVLRPRLLERLQKGVQRRLTLISAPAGFGKTTLISAWVTSRRQPTAWLSLDAEESNPIRFLIYLIAALQRVAPSVGKEILALLQSPQPPTDSAGREFVLTALLNEIAAIEDDTLLVLDDYHLLDAAAIDEALTFLLDHLPPQMHVVITTRIDPDLPLARYRARGQLTEVRAADLRFTPAEAAQFLNQGMGLSLSEEEVAALEARTEGWIAGLQMAALSMAGREDTAHFIQAFAGSHRFVLDYLTEEVLQRQPDHVRRFLLQTALLDQLSGPLCNAITGQEDSQGILEELERGNLFVIPLDDQRQWYRYHHLFVDVLQARLLAEQPERMSSLHQRASEWYEQNALPAAAIRHAFAAADFVRAAALVEMAWPAIFKGFHPTTWLGWVQALPADLVRARPVLSVGYAWTLLDGGELEAVEAHLRAAERWLEAPAPETGDEAPTPEAGDEAMVVVNEAEFRTLPATIATGRAYLARTRGDAPATIKHALRALDLLPETDHYWRGVTAMFLGMAYWASDELEAAYRAIVDSMASLQRAGHLHFQLVGTVVLADIRVMQGRLDDAVLIYEQALQLASSPKNRAHITEAGPGEPMLQGQANLHVGLSELYCERGDREGAAQHLERAKALGKHALLPGGEYRLYTALARLQEAQGDLAGALALLDEAARLENRDAPNAQPVAALKARLWVKQGRLAEALAWAHDRGLSANDNLSYPHEFEQITLARVLIAADRQMGAESSLHAAMGLLERLLQAAQAGGRTGTVIEVLILQALAHQVQNDIPAALVPLEQALTLAGGPTGAVGYVRRFVDEAQSFGESKTGPMQTLLAESLAHGGDPRYITQLLAMLNQPIGVIGGDETAIADPNQLLIEPLSERELEVLRLLAIGHTNQAVADELIIALSTVKKHVNNIFGKLGVGRRTQAVSRARELGLL